MTDTDFDYPPTRTWSLEAALQAVESAVDDEDAPVDESHRDALQWAVEEFGAEAEVTLQAFTTAQRDRVIDTANRTSMGALGASQLRTWLIAGSIQTAPWVDAGADLEATKDAVDALPPGLTDWLDIKLEALNDLGN